MGTNINLTLQQPLINEQGGIWWDNYHGEQVILFDDYRGETRFAEMLRICHEHKYKGNVKGSQASINATIIVITSNEPWTMWEKWKGHDKSPWERRVTDWLEFKWIPDPEDFTQQAVHVTVHKGEYIECDDPPHDGAPTLEDDQVEDILTLKSRS